MKEGAVGHSFERGILKDHSSQVCNNFALWLKRNRFFKWISIFLFGLICMFAKIEQSLKMTFQLSWASGFRNVESMNGNERTIVDK